MSNGDRSEAVMAAGKYDGFGDLLLLLDDADEERIIRGDDDCRGLLSMMMVERHRKGYVAVIGWLIARLVGKR
jgi:hypothetical protein